MIEPVRFENSQPLLIAGLRGHFSTATWQGIPAQWQRLASYGKIPGQVNSVGYGLCFQESDGIDYLTGFEVSSLKGLPAELFHSNIPAQTYAIFSHGEHVSKLRSTLDAIHEWCSASVYKPPSAVDGAPDFFERYGPGFHPQNGMGDIEVWVPVDRKIQTREIQTREQR